MPGKFIFTIILSLCSTNFLNAQISRLMYFMDLPQSRIMNPALRPVDSLYIGLPVLSGIGVNLSNNFINFSDVLIKGRNDSLISVLHPDYDNGRFLSGTRRNNFAGAELTVQLFGLGFTTGKNYIFFDINERIHTNVNIPGEALRLAFDGNEQYAGKYVDLSSLHGGMKYFREFGLGFSRNFSSALRAGARIKFLYGMASGAVRNKSLGINIGQDYSQVIDADFSANLSAPVTIAQDENNRVHAPDFDNEGFSETVFMRSRNINPGFAFDLGMTYRVSDRISASAAITDLGLIRWRKDISTLTIDDRFEFTGIDLTDVTNGTRSIGEVGSQIADTLDNYVNLSQGSDPFNSYMPAGISLAGSYILNRMITLGLLSYSRFAGNQIRQSMTLSANFKLGNSLSSTLSYTAANHRLDNLGAGLAFRLGIFQFYALTDRIPVSWDRIELDSNNEANSSKNTIFVPAMNMVDLRLGMNLVFGHRRKAKAEECEVVY